MNLDSLDQMQALDKQGVYLSITSLVDQMKSAKKAVDSIEISPEYKLVKNVVLAGMGGSALAGRVIKSLYANKLRIPFEVVTEFSLPEYVNENSLVILSSYSGNTEETISAANEAKAKGALIFGITTGGKLKDFLMENEYPHYVIDTQDNPSNQPRMSLGYTIMALVVLLNKCSVLSITELEINEAIETSESLTTKFSARESSVDNTAKLLAKKLMDKIPVFVSSEHLYEATHPFKNQLNENAKTFAIHFGIPELNHHLLEGMKYPLQASKTLYFVFFESDLYSDQVKKRYPITKEVVEKQGYNYSVYELESNKKLDQVLEILILGSYVSFYIAMLREFDPAPIPWVDYFKERL